MENILMSSIKKYQMIEALAFLFLFFIRLELNRTLILNILGVK